jgi:putative ABC transport system permease protein
MSTSRRLFSLGIFRRRAARAEMMEELAFHVDARVNELVARGMSPDDARAEALRRIGGDLDDAGKRLGDSAELKERRLDVRDRIHDFIDDVGYALRGLRRSPGFTTVAVLTLAIGIGANTALFSAVDALLLRALPFREPQRLMDVVQTLDAGGTAQWSFPRYAFYRDAQKSFGSLAVHRSRPVTLTGTDPQRVTIEDVSPQYLRTLAIDVARGRDFGADVDVAGGAPRQVILTDAMWQSRFGADPGILGKNLLIDNQPWEIIGVLPPGFRGLSGNAAAFLNLTARAPESLAESWSLEYSMIARLAEGVTAQQASSEARGLGPRIAAAFPSQAGTLTTSRAPEKWSADAHPLDDIRVADGVRRSLLVLFGAVGLVLLIACVNLANLLIARAVSRKREIAVRLAIGAGRGRLVRMLVTESLILAVLGGVASLAIAVAGTRVLSTINPQETLRVQGLSGGLGVAGFETISFSGTALAFTFIVTLAVGLLFGLLPALRATRTELTSDLKDGRAGHGAVRRVGGGRRALVVAEIALALVLLAGSGLMIRSLGNLLNVDPGFDGTNTLTLRLAVPAGVVAPDSMPGFYGQLQEAIQGLPGVESVALADCPPLSGGCNGTIMTFADRPPSATGNAMVGVHWVSANWFSTMRVPLKRGRLFTDADRLGAPKVVLINEAAAREYFPGEDPIGKRVAVYQGGFNTGAEVVGIVGDVRFGTIDSTARPDTYISYGQARLPRMMIFVRTTGDASVLTAPVRAMVRRIAPQMPVFDIMPMRDRMGAATSQARFSAVLLTIFAIVALSLAVIGIYGVVSFGVAQRTREIGIRMALGADGQGITGLVLREGTLLAALGVVIGLAGALAGTRALRTMLFEVTTTDPVTYGGIVLVLVVAVLLANWLPARRAARVDPMIALRRG